MTWFGSLLVFYYIFNAVYTVNSIGKPREVVTPPAAAVVVVIYTLLIWGVVAVGTG